MASNKCLGKGLGALLGDFSEEPVSDSAYRLLPIYKVEPNPDQPRHDFDEEELEALSESDHGGADEQHVAAHDRKCRDCRVPEGVCRKV